MADASGVLIRDAEPDDEAAWRGLWAAYVAFYESEVSDEVTAGTWARLLDPGSGMSCRVAELNGEEVGFTLAVLHPGSWTLAPTCYLEDLFVAPHARGHGLGGALIDDLVALGRDKGWSRLYWHTKRSNETARRLYDRYGKADDFVRYRLLLD